GGWGESVALGHLGVGNRELVGGALPRRALELLEPCVRARRFCDADAFGGEHVPEQAAVRLVVVHDKGPAAAEGRRRREPGRRRYDRESNGKMKLAAPSHLA